MTNVEKLGKKLYPFPGSSVMCTAVNDGVGARELLINAAFIYRARTEGQYCYRCPADRDGNCKRLYDELHGKK